MSLFDQISEDIKKAMLAREKEKLEALRSIKAALLLLKTDGSGVEITPEKEIALLQKLFKQRKDSAELYSANNRQELADKELFEATVIEVYLPKKMNKEELVAAIKDIVATTGAVSQADFGKVMGMASKVLAGKADGKDIAAEVKIILSGL